MIDDVGLSHSKSSQQEQSLSGKNSKDGAEKSLKSGSSETVSRNELQLVGSVNIEQDQLEENEVENAEQEPKPFSYIEMLDVPRELQEPVDITLDHLKQISEELGLIKLCWPDLNDVTFEDRTNFPSSYLKNSNKEKLLLLYAENFRRQFCHKYPERKPLFLACDNECGMQKMVCTTIRPTTLPYAEMYEWKDCARFVADHLRYEPLEEPVLIVSTK